MYTTLYTSTYTAPKRTVYVKLIIKQSHNVLMCYCYWEELFQKCRSSSPRIANWNMIPFLLLQTTYIVVTSDNFWSAFCVFHAHFWGKTHIFKICALKKRNDFRQLKRSNFSNSSAKQRRIYQSSWMTWPIRLWLLWGIVLWKEILWIVFISIKCICFIIKINNVWSRVKNIALKKTIVFPKKTIVFQHVHFFIPLFWNEKLSLIICMLLFH